MPHNDMTRTSRVPCRTTIRQAAASLLALLLFSTSLAAGSEGASYRKPVEKDKCPVCGMFVARYPDWIAEVIFRDGTYLVFDGPKDLFHCLTDMKKYASGRTKEDIQALFVMDYYELVPIDGVKAWYVTGSDVYGPMGAELIPFRKETDAREFLKDHQGSRIVSYKDVTAQVLKALR